jgi:hypothetical protein
MKVLAAVLLRFFVSTLRDEEASVNYRATITLLIEHGLQGRSYRVCQVYTGIPADPTCIRVYVLYLKKTKTKEHLPVS